MKRVIAAVLGVGCVVLGVAVTAQAPPATEIFLVSVTTAGGKTTVGRPVNVTNNPGYDNQPHFLSDSSGFLFSSVREGNQNDIYRYDIAAKRVVQVTRTADNEYSPTPTPEGHTFSTIRGAQQKLWRFFMDGTDGGLAWSLPQLIGYHAWISPTQLAVFVLGEQRRPNTLQLLDIRAGSATVIEESIGRSILIRPGGRTVSYVHKPQGQPWVIKELDPATQQTRVITPTLEGAEDLTWTPDGRIVMGQKGKLFVWAAGSQGWAEIADLTRQGVEGITRLNMSPDGKWLAIVSQAPAAAARQ